MSQIDPVVFVKRAFGIEPYEYQKKILYAIADFDNVTVRTGHGVGKTALDAWVCFYFLITRPYSKIIITMPTGRQVKGTLWAEIAKWYRMLIPELQNEIELQTQAMKVKSNPNEWFAIGFSAKKGVNVEGWHNSEILLIVDEAKGVDDQIFISLQGALTTLNAKQLYTSTPGPSTGEFWRTFNKAGYENFKRFHVSCYDAPESQVSRAWIEDKKKKWGADSALFKMRVLGEFAVDASDQLISYDWIHRANKQYTDYAAYGTTAGLSTIGGLDVAASEEGNETVFSAVRPAINPQDISILTKQESWRNPDTMYTVGKTTELYRKHNMRELRVDADGLGIGVYDRLKEIGLNVVAIRNGEAAGNNIYHYVRDEMAYEVRNLLQQGRLALPEEEVLTNQLLQIKKKYRSDEKMMIESKKEMKERGLDSPDRFDSLAMAVYEHPLKAATKIESPPLFEIVQNMDLQIR